MANGLLLLKGQSVPSRPTPSAPPTCTHNNKTSMHAALCSFLGIAVQLRAGYFDARLFRMIAVFCFDFWLTIRRDVQDLTRDDEVTGSSVYVVSP